MRPAHGRGAAAGNRRTAGSHTLPFGIIAFILAVASPPRLPGYSWRLLMKDSRIEPPSPSSGMIAQAIRYNRMPSP